MLKLLLQSKLDKYHILQPDIMIEKLPKIVTNDVILE
jgi:hypothetical protein